MKHINSPLIRIVFAIITGLVLVIWPGTASDYLVITIGILFIIPGLLGLIGYVAASRDVPLNFPIAALGSSLFGLWLVIMPGFFANLLMYALGLILMIGGIHQIYAVVIARRWTTAPLGFYILPLLTLLAGLLVVINPSGIREAAFIIIGITCFVYAAAELINWLRFTNQKPKILEKREDMEEIEN